MNERYSRQIVLKNFGAAGQEKLGMAAVLVIGAGGLGCPALQYLAGAGLGHIGIADGDTVSLNNLHRQVLYNTEDVGKMKTEVAFEKLTAINPELRIDTYPFRIKANNCLDILDRYDVVLDCSDNFETRYLVNDACVLLDKPLIFAAVSAWEGQLAVFHKATDTDIRTNYRDLFPNQPGNDEIPNCEENGVIGVLPGILGTMQAAEAIKLITGSGKPLINQLLNYNLLQQSIYTLDITPAPAGTYLLQQSKTEFSDIKCQLFPAENYMDIAKIGIGQLNELLGTDSTLIIDVREIHERPLLSIKHLKLPMSVFKAVLPAEINEQHIVLICQHGGRSMTAARILESIYGNKKNIYSLAGGVTRWSEQLQWSNE